MKRALFAALVAGAVAVPSAADAFCGFYVSGADTKLYNNATQVVLMRDGTRTVLSMQNNYQGPPEAFAMVVPVPVVLQKENVKTLPREVFDRVDNLAAPRLVEYWEQDPCAPVYPESKMAPGGPLRMASRGGGGRSDEDLGVKVEAQFSVGEYEVVVLSAKDAGGLDAWLKQNKYKIPDGAEPLFKPYIQQGSKFFVAKVDPAKVKFENGMATLSPLRFHYDTDKFNLPIRLGLINAKGAQDLLVHILAKGQRYEVANYPNVTIPTNIDVSEKLRGDFGGFYAALFDRTLEKNPKAVVTEYAWGAGSCDPCPGPVLAWNDLATLGADVIDQAGGGGGAPAPGGPMGRGGRMSWQPNGFVLTRLHARYTKDSLGEDLVFRAAEPIVGGREFMQQNGKLEEGAVKSSINNFQGRYAIRHPWTGPIACKEPRRGVWGGPPAGITATGTKPAKNLAFAARGGVELASFVQKDVPEIGVKGAAPPNSGVGPAPDGGVVATAAPSATAAGSASASPSAAPSATPATTSSAGDKKGGCSTAGGASGGLLGLLAALGVVALRRRRSS